MRVAVSEAHAKLTDRIGISAGGFFMSTKLGPKDGHATDPMLYVLDPRTQSIGLVKIIASPENSSVALQTRATLASQLPKLPRT